QGAARRNQELHRHRLALRSARVSRDPHRHRRDDAGSRRRAGARRNAPPGNHRQPLMARPVYVVLGMHRGGTSAIARGLAALGVSLGDNLWDAKPENERGYWEDRDVHDLNEALLAALDEPWHSVRPYDARSIEPHRLEALLARGRELLEAKLRA